MVLRPREVELVEEDPRERVVVVLAGVDQHLGRDRAQAVRNRRGLDELRAVADDGEDAHREEPTARSTAVSRERNVGSGSRGAPPEYGEGGGEVSRPNQGTCLTRH